MEKNGHEEEIKGTRWRQGRTGRSHTQLFGRGDGWTAGRRLLRRRCLGFPGLLLLLDRVLDEFLHLLRLGEISRLFAL